MAIFKGAASALITPFTEDYKVDFNKLEELVDIQIENGVDAIERLSVSSPKDGE